MVLLTLLLAAAPAHSQETAPAAGGDALPDSPSGPAPGPDTVDIPAHPDGGPDGGDRPGPVPVGVWLTQGNDGGIEIRQCGDAPCGFLVWLGDTDDRPRDEHNPKRWLRSRPLCGLPLLGGFHWRQGGWRAGWIYDPGSGSTFSAEMTLQADDKLEMRGYLGLPTLGRSQIWTRAPTDLPRCQP